MRREEATAERDRLQQADRTHSYLLRERSDGDWEVVRIDVARQPEGFKAERGEPTEPPPDQRPSLIRQIPPYGPPGF